MRKTIYETNYTRLSKIMNGELENMKGNYKLKSKGFMDLVIEKLRVASDKTFVISLAHYYEQNGDLMADPDMEIKVYPELKAIEVLNYTNHSLGFYREVYFEEDGKKYVKNVLKRDLNDFLRTWLKNLESQGFNYANEQKEVVSNE